LVWNYFDLKKHLGYIERDLEKERESEIVFSRSAELAFLVLRGSVSSGKKRDKYFQPEPY
jgi:hypothetical protein